MTESLRIPCGPIHSTNSRVPCLVMKGEAQWIKQTPPESILTHLEPSKLGLGPRRGGHCGRDEQSIPAAQPCLRSLGKPWQRALSEVLRLSPLRNSCFSLFFFSSRPPTGKTKKEKKRENIGGGESRNGEKEDDAGGQEKEECRKEKTQCIAHGGCHKRAH